MTALYLDAHESAALLGIGLRTLHKLRHDPTFPQPRCFGERATRWKASELEAWADTRTGGKRSEPVALTTARAAKRGPKGGRSGGTATPRAQDPLQSCSLKSQEDFVPSATPVEAVAA